MNERQRPVQNLAVAALMLALGYVLPFFTGNIPQIGSMLCPMHLPVLLCGLLCGWRYGLAVGFVLPLARSFLVGMPPLFPAAAAMAFELAAYGFLAGFLYARSRWQCVVALYRCLIAAMLGGGSSGPRSGSFSRACPARRSPGRCSSPARSSPPSPALSSSWPSSRR